MLGMDDAELEAYLEDYPQVVPLFEIDIIETAADYTPNNTLQEEAYEPDPESIMELSRARERVRKGNGNLAKGYCFNIGKN